MKKIILTFITAATALSLQAQNINPEGDHTRRSIDAPAMPTRADSMSGWVLDFNVMLGYLNQQYDNNFLTDGYTNALNPNEGALKFHNGMSYGFEAQGGYFFGKKRHWGVGMGLTYLYQTGNVTMDRFHVEYAAYDKFGNIFRQELTANHEIKERLRISSFNIPIVAKYQTRLSKKVGFTADAGLLFNLHVQNNYKTDASFDYEAIYQYVTGPEGKVTTTYDNLNPPSSSDLLITKAQYAAHPGSSIQDYFNTLQGQGYNVGLNENPRSNKGHVSYMSGSVGILIRPAITIDMTHNLALTLGAYYYFQDFNNKSVSGYKITDKVGDYSSLLNSVTNTLNNSVGVNIGLRYSFSKKKPAEAAPETAPAPEPAEPQEPASPSPEPDEPEETNNIDISTPLLFDLNKVVIKESSIPILDEAIREMKSNPGATIVIHGYTDNTGSADYNKKLSKKRAVVVKNYLKNHGVDPKMLKAVGHGESHPARSNRTREGRMRNRRVIMKKKD